MPQIDIYQGDTKLPEHFEHQIRSFIRINWWDGYAHGDLEFTLSHVGENAIHLVLAEQHALISHVGIIHREITHTPTGQTFKMAGVGGVFTYPAFEKRGHGAALVRQATDLIRAEPDIDLGMLFTRPELEKFYGQHGWETMEKLKIMQGDPPKEHDHYTMVLLVSDKAKAARALFETGPFYVGLWSW